MYVYCLSDNYLIYKFQRQTSRPIMWFRHVNWGPPNSNSRSEILLRKKPPAPHHHRLDDDFFTQIFLVDREGKERS